MPVGIGTVFFIDTLIFLDVGIVTVSNNIQQTLRDETFEVNVLAKRLTRMTFSINRTICQFLHLTVTLQRVGRTLVCSFAHISYHIHINVLMTVTLRICSQIQ